VLRESAIAISCCLVLAGALSADRGRGGPINAAAHKPWPQEPAGFRGVPWASSIADVRKAIPEGYVHSTGIRFQVDRFEVGTVTTRLYIYFKTVGANMTGGGLWNIDMEFPLSDMSNMNEILVAKYGPPTGYRTEDGDRLMQWQGKQVRIELGPYSVEHKGHATFTALAVDAQWNKEAAENRARGKTKQTKKNRKAAEAF